MKRIKTHGNAYGLEYEGWLIETLEDIVEYVAMIDPNFRKGIKSLLKTKVTPDRWDHLIRLDAFGGLLAYAFTKCNMSGGNILMSIGSALDVKITNFKKHILLGRKIIVNDIGGYCFLHDEYEVVEHHKKKIEYYIGTGKYINLENDPILEDYTCEHVPNCSYILNTYSLTEDELKNVLIEFKENGGIGIWQYTTGTDIEQLYLFMKLGLEIGLTEYIFNFNSGLNDGLIEFINDFKDTNGIKFVYNGVN